MKKAILYGIGVGPGDPELLTLKAVRLLGRMPAIFAAASSRNEFSHALETARPYLMPGALLRDLAFPMLRDRASLKRAWKKNARIVAETLRDTREGAFLTLGDPLLYSTFGYLMCTLQEHVPEIEVQVIPGITSFQAAAASTRTILCESEENLLILSGIADGETLEKTLAAADNAVILKAYRNYGAIRETLRKTGRESRSIFVSCVGKPGEIAVPLEKGPEHPHYLSLVLSGNPKKECAAKKHGAKTDGDRGDFQAGGENDGAPRARMPKAPPERQA